MDLSGGLLDDTPREEWPNVVAVLQDTAARKAAGQRRDLDEVLRENEQIRTLLNEYQERERRRREFAARQRRQKQARASRPRPS